MLSRGLTKYFNYYRNNHDELLFTTYLFIDIGYNMVKSQTSVKIKKSTDYILIGQACNIQSITGLFNKWNNFCLVQYFLLYFFNYLSAKIIIF